MPITNIDIAHHKIHEGVTFTADYLKEAVANDGFERVHIKAVDKHIHLVIKSDVGGKFTFKTYSDTTYTALGTLSNGVNLTKYNRKIGGDNSNALVYFAPTVNALGTLRVNTLLPGGTGPQTTGASDGSRVETIIPAGHDLLLVYQNKSGQAKDMSVTLEWYEIDPVYQEVFYDLSLSALALEDDTQTPVALNPVFASGTKTYTASVANAITSVTISGTGQAEDLSTDFFIRGLGTKPLVVGANVFNVDVLKYGKYNPSRYTITVTRAA